MATWLTAPPCGPFAASLHGGRAGLPESREDPGELSEDGATETRESLERLHDAHDQAAQAHRRAKRAFDKLEQAHQRGEPGIEEHGQFGDRLRELRQAAADVRRQADEVRRQTARERRKSSRGEAKVQDEPD
jgi:hypothetical protein